MRSGVIVISSTGLQNPAQMCLAQDNDVSTHSRWIDPISRSAKSFCKGEAMRGGILVREQGISACRSQSHRRMRFSVHKRTFAPQKATSALPPKADIATGLIDYFMARPSSDDGTVRPSIRAVCALMTNSSAGLT